MGGVAGHNRGILKESEHSIIGKNLSILCTGLDMSVFCHQEEGKESQPAWPTDHSKNSLWAIIIFDISITHLVIDERVSVAMILPT